MRKFLGALLLALFFLSFSTHFAFAQTKTVTPTPVAQPVNSYELLWPMVAGKTEADSFYFLKTLKEQIRGWFIFGAAQKSDYQVFIGTKRVLEAEKLIGTKAPLISENKGDLAVRTLDKATAQFDQARANFEKAKAAGTDIATVQAGIKNRLANVEKLVAWLSSQTSGEVKTKLGELATQATAFLAILQ